MPARKIKAYRTPNSLRMSIPRQIVQELGLVHRQRMSFIPYKNGLKAIPLEPHQAVTWWMQVRRLHVGHGRFRVTLPLEICQTLGLKAKDVIKIKLDELDGKRFLVLTRQEGFIAAVALHDSPSIHLVARPVTADGKIDKTRPCIKTILPYPDAAERLGGLEIYNAGDFAEGLEAHLKTAGQFHDAPPKPCQSDPFSKKVKLQ